VIDVTKCELEDIFCDPEFQCKTIYFTYPKELGDAVLGTVDWQEDEPVYGEIICYCISLTVYDDGYDLSMSPTVCDGDSMSDICWCDLTYGIDYDEDTIKALLAKAN